MNLTAIKDHSGAISEVRIPATDLSEIKASVKKGTVFYSFLEGLDFGNDQPVDDVILSSGLSLEETNAATAAQTENIYREAFEKGTPVYYQDERASNPHEFIRANPDGSEDLVQYDFEGENDVLLKSLVAPGQSQFAYLSPLTAQGHETTVLPAGRSQRRR